MRGNNSLRAQYLRFFLVLTIVVFGCEKKPSSPQPAPNAPQLSNPPNQTISEGESFSPIHLDDYVTDTDHADGELTWSVSGTSDLTVRLDSARNAEVIVPSDDWNGTETITFTVSDPDDHSASGHLLVWCSSERPSRQLHH